MTLRVAARAREVEELRCPLCLDALGPGDGRCGACGTPHHAACIDELRGCALLGCTGAPAQLPDRERAIFRARRRARGRPHDTGPEHRDDLYGGSRGRAPPRDEGFVERFLTWFVALALACLPLLGACVAVRWFGWPLAALTAVFASSAVWSGVLILFVVVAMRRAARSPG